jgi:glycosyltransferase involved in cell wall biosynthesis
MKIGFIVDFLYRNPTGIAHYSYGIIEAFRKCYPNFEYYYFVPSGVNIKYHHFSFNKKDKIIIPIRSKLISKKTLLWNNLLPPFTRNYNLDYIFNFTSCPHFFNFSQKEVLVIHDLTSVLFPKYHRWQFVLSSRLFFKKNVKNAHKILVNSSTTKKDLINFFPWSDKKTFTLYVPNFVYTEIKEKKVDKVKPYTYILNINTLEPRKNIVRLIDAYEQLKREKKFITLLL